MLNKESLGFVAYFARAYPARSGLMVGLMILSGVAEGFGILTLLPLLELASGGTAGRESSVARAVTDLLGSLNITPSLAVLLVLMVVAIALKAAFLWTAMIQAGYTVAHVTADLRLQVMRALLAARWSHFTSRPAGQFANAVGTEAHRASGAYREACRVLAGVIQVAVYVGLAFLMSPGVALLALVGGLTIMLLLGRFVDASRRSGKSQTVLMRSLITRLTDSLHGIKAIKAMAQEEHLAPLLEQETQAINVAEVRHVLARQSMVAFQEPLMALMLAAGLYVALGVANQPFSTLLVLVFLFYRLVGRINLMQSEYQSMVLGESAFWSLRETIDCAAAEREISTGTREPPALTDGVTLRNVSFAYGTKEILSDVSLTIPVGELVAIVGPSGAGKTTIADLIVGLHLPTSGEVYVDGIPLSELDIMAWRRRIGYVPQEMLLFHDSIYRNVTLGDPHVPRDAVREALVAAGAWGFVGGLEDGMDTVIGEMGSKLSGGQRQRVAIARALLRKPSLLVLDEVTTALDPATEAALCSTLAGLKGATTIVAVSHQPAIVEVADAVYRVEGGKIAQTSSGKPALKRMAP
jgi:ATP-binding cassette, subfamily C, bacterial